MRQFCTAVLVLGLRAGVGSADEVIPDEFQRLIDDLFPQEASGEVRYRFEMEHFPNPALSSAEREAAVAARLGRISRQNLKPNAHVGELTRRRHLGGRLPETELRILLNGHRVRFDMDVPWNGDMHFAMSEDGAHHDSYYLHPQFTRARTENPLRYNGGMVERGPAGMPRYVMWARGWYEAFPAEALLARHEDREWTRREEQNGRVVWLLEVKPLPGDRYRHVSLHRFQKEPSLQSDTLLLTESIITALQGSQEVESAPGNRMHLSDYRAAWDGFIPGRMRFENWNPSVPSSPETEAYLAQATTLTHVSMGESSREVRSVFHDLVSPMVSMPAHHDPVTNRTELATFPFQPSMTHEEWARYAESQVRSRQFGLTVGPWVPTMLKVLGAAAAGVVLLLVSATVVALVRRRA